LTAKGNQYFIQAVYQKFIYEEQKNVCILVQPEAHVIKRVGESSTFRARHHNPLLHHLIFLSAAADNWGAYFNDLEAEFKEKVIEKRPCRSRTYTWPAHQVLQTINAVEFKVGIELPNNDRTAGNEDPRDQLEIGFRDLQILQRFEEQVQKFQAALDINHEVISSLRTLNSDLWRFARVQDQDAEIAWHYVDSVFGQRLSEISHHKRNIGDLLGAIRGRRGLVRRKKNMSAIELHQLTSSVTSSTTRWSTRPALNCPSLNRRRSKTVSKPV
jgi:hypothetical protein